MSSKEIILNKIKSSGYKMPNIDVSAPSQNPSSHIISSDDDIYAEFTQRIVANKALLVESSPEKLNEDIQKIIDKETVKNLIYPDSLSFDVANLNIENKFKFDKPVDGFKAQIFDYDVSIIDARGGVSSHGVACIASSKSQPRLLSLTPKVCIALIKKDSIVKSLCDMLNKIKKEDGKLPTNVVFISGPSRTSDIELQLVLGVHGSQIFYAITY
ncbi:LutC/YkgG family protein [Campylobacter fetus]|uniref:LutC/YkgG family protein n=1 Tax=Campylobacter fetus TaxID=196 RepID=UPI00288D8A27|nr:lactate utilization protein C [Campylobacter fetus subsp. venerealis]